MNLTRALDVALPEIPARLIAQTCPRLHPDVVFKEHIVDGRPTVRIFVPGVDAMFNLAPPTWELVRFFDGQRSFEQVAEAYTRETGIPISLDDVHGLADDLESIEFWYKTPREKNIALMLQTADQRRNAVKQKKKWGDLAFIKFPAFNPDSFLVWLERRIRFVFTWWFTLLTLAAFACTATIFLLHWSEVGHDTLQFFNFADKTWLDLAAFWGITLVLSAIHEAAHGVTCRHFGGPGFVDGFCLDLPGAGLFTDTTEGVVLCPPFERVLISVAGVWSELYLCTVATVIWWGTPPGTPVHDFAYVVMLMTGIATLLINWNPLMKLDGYHILCDVIGILDLKENSTAYVSAWVKRHVWRLPVEVPYVPKRRRLGFAVYAITSGLYSYTILYIVARFVGNVFRNFNPDWSFIPELATGALIFRSRIRSSVNLMKFVYLDKKDRLRIWLTSNWRPWAVAGIIGFLFLPLWRQSISGRFILEASDRAVIRAQVAGSVEKVYAEEGQTVTSGAPLVQLRSVPLDAKQARSEADYRMALADVNSAELHYAGTGAASQKRDQFAQEARILASEVATLELKTPISGVVTTARLSDRIGSYVTAGTELAEVDDTRIMRARIFVSEHEMYKYRPNARRPTAGGWYISQVGCRFANGFTHLFRDCAGVARSGEVQGDARRPTFYAIDLLVNNEDGSSEARGWWARPGSMAGDAALPVFATGQ